MLVKLKVINEVALRVRIHKRHQSTVTYVYWCYHLISRGHKIRLSISLLLVHIHIISVIIVALTVKNIDTIVAIILEVLLSLVVVLSVGNKRLIVKVDLEDSLDV